MSENNEATIKRAEEIKNEKPSLIDKAADGVANFKTNHPVATKVVKGVVNGIIAIGCIAIGAFGHKKATEYRQSKDEEFIIESDDASENSENNKFED